MKFKKNIICAADFVKEIQRIDFSKYPATVVGYGNMGKQYVKALLSLGAGPIRVCARSENSIKDLSPAENLIVHTGGYQHLKSVAATDELAIIATPVEDLIPATYHLLELGYRRFLIEKPISLWSSELEEFQRKVFGSGAEFFCAYNRVAYPVVLEALYLAQREGGITSCTYTFTEFTDRLDPKNYTAFEMQRWGIANSLHVMSMGHALIGMPLSWKAFQSGFQVQWHPSGSVFVGAGISEEGIPFSYHADWGSTGRWSVEIHTKVASYRFCPLEKLFKRASFSGAWEEIPVSALTPDVKVGITEQVAAALDRRLQAFIPLVSLQQSIALTQFGEEVFKYEH